MATGVLEPPVSKDELRERAGELLRDELQDQYEFEQGAEEEPNQRVEEREEWFSDLRASVLAIARSKSWEAHDLKAELLLTMEDLWDAIEADPEATDPEWKQREASMRMRVVIEAMLRQIDHAAIDSPERAAMLTATELASVGDREIADLLSTTPRMIGKYREGVSEIRKDPDRAVLVGQLVYELRGSRTPRGVLMWFDAPREALAGKTPRELIDADPKAAFERLISLARGGRAQLDAA